MTTLNTMSGIHKYPRGKPTPTTFILSCQRAVFTEEVIHEQWLPAEQLLVHMHTKFNISEDIHFSQAAMMRVVNKVLPLVSTEHNIMEDTDGIQLRVYRHSFQVKKSYFFWVSRTDDGITAQTMPSQRNATNWEEDCVLKRLIDGARTHLLTSEPQAKQSKVSEGARIETMIRDPSDPSLCGATTQQAAINNSFTSSRWESGDARKRFAPCSANYGAEECVKAIVMD